MPARTRLLLPLACLAGCSLLPAAGTAPDSAASAAAQPVVAAPQALADRVAQGPARLLVAADIGQCDAQGGAGTPVLATAALLQDRPGLVLAAGDLAYPDGRTTDFARCYDPAWGTVKSRTLPVPGNHEYHQAGATPYYDYFGAQAGTRGEGWYSVNFHGWHLVGLNSNLKDADAAAQLAWLRTDLAHRPAGCLLAFWHHPRFSSGQHGANTVMAEAWTLLAQAGADVVLNGHDHDYERFAPLGADGLPAVDGIREFVVGTGGAALTPIARVHAQSEVRDDHTFGILEMDLSPDHYRWRFLGTEGAEFEDRGEATCHSTGPA